MIIGKLLDSLQMNMPNVYVLLMMFCFVSFFESVGRVFDYILPNHTSIWSLMIALVMMLVSILVFLAQDGSLTELSLNHKKEQNGGVGGTAGAVISAVRMRN